MLGLTLLLASFLGFQQPTTPVLGPAQVDGKVIDRAGLVLPGVTVTLQAPPPATVQALVTDADGMFRFRGVTPGTYTVTFELAGFSPYSRTALALAAGQTRTLTVALDVASSLAMVVTRGEKDMMVDTKPDKVAKATAPVAKAPSPAPDPKFDLAPGEIAVGIETSLGTFYIAVDPKRAPITATNFLRYVDAKLYDWGRFHRATRPDNYTPAPPNRPMMNIIQGGINPARRDEGFPAIPLERTTLTGIKHIVGVVSMARGAPDSATSDFFVLLDDQPSLDYGGLRFEDGQGGGAFGHVLFGLDVVKKIQQQPVDGDRLSGPVTIRRVWRLK
jgi:peptidyl-prolyl cis-trans isomerase A (cyclophilin A)